MLKSLGLAAVAAAAISVSAPAQAQAVTYTFEGNCVDCAATAGTPTFPVNAALTLVAYTEGTPLVPNHFVSFFYGGSNLLDPYMVLDDYGGGPLPGLPAGTRIHTMYEISGSLVTGGAQMLSLRFGDGLEFDLANGQFFTCGGQGGQYYAVPCSWMQNNDFGTGSFVEAPIPEPGTWALMALGLAGLGAAARRRRAG